jgi:aerobic-type carbon monoxide dehydrogenase small subunit (CoxS/CutS family)
MSEEREINITVNGRAVRAMVEPRLLLSDFLRGEAGLTGTHVGCEHGVCGACTVLFDGEAARSCLMFAVQADGCEVQTIEGLADCGTIAELQDAFARHHALQCGFCTPGMLVIAHDFLNANPLPSEQDVKEGMSAALCRCTGYLGIIKAVSEVAAARARSAAGRAGEDR